MNTAPGNQYPGQHPYSAHKAFNILLIDDSRTARLVLKTQMEAMGKDVSVQCIDPDKHGLPDADYDWSDIDHVVINQNLGSHTGLEWYQQTSVRRPLPATTLLSGTHTDTLEQAALRAGMNGLVTKNAMAATRLVQGIQSDRRLGA